MEHKILNTEEAANSDLGAVRRSDLDYSLKNGEKVWFTYKIEPKEESDWIEAEILDLNWAYKAAAIQLKGYAGVSCHGIFALSRVRHYA
jgi:hypothetical protein